MKIYTKTGDDGSTGLVSGRISKDDVIIETVGSIDELNASLGIALASCKHTHIAEILEKLQNYLFDVGSEVAGGSIFVDASIITELEAHIDELSAKLSPLKNFILPGGSKLAAHLHLSRTICRRSERRAVRLKKEYPKFNNEIILFLNRLSDLLFVMARYANHLEKIKDVEWKK